MNKFLIFASPRTGSSNLANAIGSLYAEELNILHAYVGEPLGSYNLSRWYKDIIRLLPSELQSIYENKISKKSFTRSQMIEVLNACHNNSFGIKHLHTHLPHFKNLSLLEYAMTKRYKIIYLTRDSHTLKDVSAQLAARTGKWGKEKSSDKKIKRSYENIDIEDLKNKASWNKKSTSLYEEFMCDYNIHRASYEQIYCQNNQLNEFHEIMDYLEIDRKKLDLNEFNTYMSYDNKQSTSTVYSEIPNIKEVIQFAKDEYNDDISYILDS